VVHFVRLCKNGNSYHVNVPRPMLRALGLRKRDVLAMDVHDHALYLVRIEETRLVRELAEDAKTKFPRRG